MLRIQRTGIGIAGLIISNILLATEVSSNTTWKLQNESDKKVTIECLGRESAGPVRMKLEPVIVAAHSRTDYAWGDAWYNDGMGLNPAEWTCKAQAEGSSVAISLPKFSTEWGELIQLSVDQSGKRFSLSRESGVTDMAQRKSRATPRSQ
jgi:hypothetical protein